MSSLGKLTDESKKQYSQRVEEYKKKVDDLTKRESMVLQLLQKDPKGIEYKKIRLAEENLTVISFYILMNELSQHLLGIKNEPFLNNARKILYKALIYLEQVVTDSIDQPFSDFLEKLEKIQSLTAEQRLQIVRKLGFAIDSVIDAFGDNTKWKWSFVDIEARYAAIAKNLMNLKFLYQDMDPMSPNYEPTMQHLDLVIKLMEKAAQKLREKYELSTHSFNDFKLAIKYLEGLRLLHMAIGKPDEANEFKRKHEVWKQKLESDMKQKGVK